MAKDQDESVLQSALEVSFESGEDFKPLGGGATARVFRYKDRTTGAERAIKILRASLLEQKDILDAFRTEPKKLASKPHPNIVQVISFGELPLSDGRAVPYYAMEYVEGTHLLDWAKGLLEDKEGDHTQILDLVRQLVVVLSHLHKPEPVVVHGDIKNENIKVIHGKERPPELKLLDFGVAIEWGPGSTPIGVQSTLANLPRSWLDKIKQVPHVGRAELVVRRKDFNPKIDLYQFSLLLRVLLGSGVELWLPDRSLRDYIAQLEERLDFERRGIPDNYSIIDGVELQLQFERLFDLDRPRKAWASGPLRLPATAVHHFAKETIAPIVDTPEFQRLRKIKQLGLTHLVYPGAVGTRFEHSLGVFENCVRYLSGLTRETSLPLFRSLLTDAEIKFTGLVALLHDIGHYPFAHLFEGEGLDLPSHEERSLEIMLSDEFKALIEKVVRVKASEFETFARYVLDPKFEKGQCPGHWRVLARLIRGPIDVDKLDYLSRDSTHCGAPYGLFIDEERLMLSLTAYEVIQEKALTGKLDLCLSDKGRICGELFAVTRYAMFSQVYWHRTVRAFTRMLIDSAKAAQTKRQEEWTSLRDACLNMGDDEFLSALNRISPHRACDLIINRKPYHRVLVVRRSPKEIEPYEIVPGESKLFDRVIKEYSADRKGLAGRIVESLEPLVRGSRALDPEQDLLLDLPSETTEVIGQLSVIPEGHDQPTDVGPLWLAVSDAFDSWVKRIRVYLHPDFTYPADIVKKLMGALIGH